MFFNTKNFHISNIICIFAVETLKNIIMDMTTFEIICWVCIGLGVVAWLYNNLS